MKSIILSRLRVKPAMTGAMRLKPAMSLVALIAVLFLGCNTDEDFDDPVITISGITVVDPVPVGNEVSVAFNVVAPASINRVTYSIVNSAGNYQIVPVAGAAGATELHVPITFNAEVGMLYIMARVTDRKGKTSEATIPITRVLDVPGIYFADNINSIDLVIIGQAFEISGEVMADVDLKEFYFTPIVNGVAQAREQLPLDGEDKQFATFSISPSTVSGLERIEFTAVDELDRTITRSFLIDRIRNIGLFMDQNSSTVLIYGASHSIRGQVFTGSPITKSKYYIVRNDSEEEDEHDVILDSENRFNFSIEIERGIIGVRVVVENEDEEDEKLWDVTVTGRLTHLTRVRVTNERYLDEDFSFFCAWKPPHVFHGDTMAKYINIADYPEYQPYNEYLDMWDLTVYQNGNMDGIALASPASYGRGFHQSNRAVHHVIRPAYRTPEGGPTNSNSAAILSRLNYLMISPRRPELETRFDRAQTEKDLWDMLDEVLSDGRTIREHFNPVTSSTTVVEAVVGGVYWIAWGPYNGSGKGGAKGANAQNGGLGLIRVVGNSGKDLPNWKWVEFDIKFPEWPNYREVYKDSWIDMRHAFNPLPDFPNGFTFPGWPTLID